MVFQNEAVDFTERGPHGQCLVADAVTLSAALDHHLNAAQMPLGALQAAYQIAF